MWHWGSLSQGGNNISTNLEGLEGLEGRKVGEEAGGGCTHQSAD